MAISSVSTFHDHKPTPAASVAKRRCFASHTGGLECPGGATLSIHVADAAKAGGTAICFESAELDAWVERLQASGMAFEAPPQDKSWGWREAYLRDPAGNLLVLCHSGEYRRFPPWRID